MAFSAPHRKCTALKKKDVVWDTENIRRIWWGGARGGAWDITLELDVETAEVVASCCASRC